MRLYIDLSKADPKPPGAPPTGGGAGGASKPPSVPGVPAAPKLASGPPKTPGAATGGSGPQIVDCPLGPACPDGGHHEMGSTKLQEHTAQAQAQMQSGVKPGNESQGESQSPAVPPGAQNIGGVGSPNDTLRTPPTVRKVSNVAGTLKNKPGDKRLEMRDHYVDQWQNWPYSTPRPSLEEHLKRQGFKARDIQEAHAEEGIDQYGARVEHTKTQADTDTVHDVKTGEAQEPGLRTMMTEAGAKGHDPDAPDERQTLSEANVPAQEDATGEGPGSKRKTLAEPVLNADPDKARQQVPNPMVANEAAVPPDSKPMDHYRLSQVARESGDEELAKFHEGMARKRTEGAGSEDHKELANQLHAEGMHEQAKYHEGIHERVNGGKKEVPPEKAKAQEAKHQEGMRDVHHEARVKAENELSSAQEKHKKLQAKAEELKAKNKEALDKYESAKKEHEKAKAQGKKRPPPEKPKLEKEPKVPERPELDKPANEHERLQHETHTSRAKKVADLAESHLANNKDLSPTERKRLERAHQMAVHHSNIGYTPTAAHKKELSDVEGAVAGMGIKENYEDVKAKEDAQVTAAAAKAAEKDRATKEKADAKQQKVAEKQQTAQQADQPKPPVTDLDHARVQDHQSKARKLREALESHMQQNPNLSPQDQAKAQSILAELEKHEQMDMVPGKAHNSELKELQQLSGDIGKKPYSPEDEESGGDSQGAVHVDTAGSYAFNMIHQGRALGQGLAASATNPHGAGGQLGSQVINYGVSGATQAGHRLLHDSNQQQRENNRPLVPPPEDKEKAEKPAAKVPA